MLIGELLVLSNFNPKYYQLFLDLLPPGEAFNKEKYTKFAKAHSYERARIEKYRKQVLNEYNPLKAIRTINEWEDYLDVDGTDKNLEDRQVQVFNKYTNRGGQTYKYLLNTISNYFPGSKPRYIEPYTSETGISCGNYLYDSDWRFVFFIDGIPLTSEKEIKVLKVLDDVIPGHTKVMLYYKFDYKKAKRIKYFEDQ